MQIKQQSEMMVNSMIDAYAKQKPNIPAAVWQDIKKLHFNDVYLKEVKKVFQENYTEAEVKDLMATVDKYGINAYKPKPAITEKLYEVGKNFGKSVGIQIQNRLKKLGY
ncbi:DUF2059 domain-containing protein [Flavobacterium humi]|uniref:Uncharacterized protein n=1 Tax=Flavobacterium humi TaxID=2562683 RepID=A0A4Z0L4G4_9FLAO|nr:hypothetical protein [Flavobacterium humi]TGD56846.1 hypothetical protein E4635_13685 [Flavobacterium humi]